MHVFPQTGKISQSSAREYLLLGCVPFAPGYIGAHTGVLPGSFFIYIYIYIHRIRTQTLSNESAVTRLRSSRLVCYHGLSVSPVNMSSCQTLPVIVKDPILSSCGSFGTRRLILLDPLQHLFLLKSLCSTLKVTMQTVYLLHTCSLYLLYIYTCLINVCLDTYPCMLSVESFYVNAVQTVFCVFQRGVGSWKNRKHKEGHPVFGSRCLLPQGQHTRQEQGSHTGTVTPKTQRSEKEIFNANHSALKINCHPLSWPTSAVHFFVKPTSTEWWHAHRWGLVLAPFKWALFSPFSPVFSLCLSSPSFLPALVSPHSLFYPACLDGWLSVFNKRQYFGKQGESPASLLCFRPVPFPA